MTQERGAVERQSCAVPNIGLQDTYLCLLLGPKCAQVVHCYGCCILCPIPIVSISRIVNFHSQISIHHPDLGCKLLLLSFFRTLSLPKSNHHTSPSLLDLADYIMS